MELRQQEAAVPGCLAVALGTSSAQESWQQAGRHHGCLCSPCQHAFCHATVGIKPAYPAGTPQHAGSASTGWQPPSDPAAQGSVWERSPGNCASLCQFLCSWPLKPSCLSGGMGVSPHLLLSPPLFIRIKEQKIASTPSDSIAWRSKAGSGALGEYLYVEFLNCNQKSYIPWHCWEAAGGMECIPRTVCTAGR